jgi:hypothetical protein
MLMGESLDRNFLMHQEQKKFVPHSQEKEKNGLSGMKSSKD